MSNRETEEQRFGDTDGTKETEDVPPLAASVKTLQEAVQLSLKDGLTENCLFIFARALKLFEITHDRRLSPEDRESAFSLWWNAAKPLLPPDANHDEWRFDFLETFDKTRAALGANLLQEAIRRADAGPMPPQAARYDSPKIKRLVAVCYHLQLLQGNSPFFLSVRDAAKIAGAGGLAQASAWLAGLVRDGVLVEVEKGTRKRATRFRFNLPGSVPAGNTSAPLPATPKVRSELGHRQSPKIRANPKAAGATRPRKPTTYQLVERKKALQDLIKGLGHQDWWSDEDRGRHKQLTKELTEVNTLLAGVGE